MSPISFPLALTPIPLLFLGKPSEANEQIQHQIIKNGASIELTDFFSPTSVQQFFWKLMLFDQEKPFFTHCFLL